MDAPIFKSSKLLCKKLKLHDYTPEPQYDIVGTEFSRRQYTGFQSGIFKRTNIRKFYVKVAKNQNCLSKKVEAAAKYNWRGRHLHCKEQYCTIKFSVTKQMFRICDIQGGTSQMWLLNT